MLFPRPYTEKNITSGYLPPHRQDHFGIDFALGRGTPIYAIAHGVVLKVQMGCTEGNMQCGGGFGNYVQIDHENGLFSVYAHLSEVSAQVGQKVGKQTIIGKEGNTGYSTGSHLHFALMKSADFATTNYINPLPYLKGELPFPKPENHSAPLKKYLGWLVCAMLLGAVLGYVYRRRVIAYLKRKTAPKPKVQNELSSNILAE